MIDWLVNLIFRFTPLRKAVFDEVHMYDHLYAIVNDPEGMEIASSTWMEGDMWYGWRYDSNAKRYYFDDIGDKSLISLLDSQFLREQDEHSLDVK
jgi:hypothetical protein